MHHRCHASGAHGDATHAAFGMNARIGLTESHAQRIGAIIVVIVVVCGQDGLDSDTACDLTSFVPTHTITNDKQVTALMDVSALTYAVIIFVVITMSPDIGTCTVTTLHGSIQNFCYISLIDSIS
jgi:hypothetical protein